MASRRSRLQIKPNIGGPKGLSKPATKGTDPKSIKTEKVNEQAAKLSNSPRKSVSANVQKGTNEEKTKENDEKVTERKDETKSSTSSGEISSPLSPRAGLRRFTKINPASPVTDAKDRNTETKSEPVKEKIVKQNAKESDTEESPSKAAAIKGISTTEDLNKEQKANMAKSTSIPPRRSRFPKAKPNVMDASKKRQRSTADRVSLSPDKGSIKKDEQPKESPLKKKKSTELTLPKQDMLIVNQDEIISEKTIEIDNGKVLEDNTPKSEQAFVPLKSPVKAPSANFTFTASPVKHANVNRSRSLSTSEAPAPKRQRRKKLDLPTDKPPDISTMTMRDLIHWNPSSNPMKQKEKKENKSSVTILDAEKENKEKVCNNDKQPEVSADTNIKTDDVDDVDSVPLPVPQVTIGPDGSIIINEGSLVVHDKSAENGPSADDEVIDETENTTTYASFRSRPTIKRWTKKETHKFYKALAMIGSDFFLIQKVFPNRTRTEIKKKFKREEKSNTRLIEKVLNEGIHFDQDFLENGEKEGLSEEEVETVKIKKEKKPKTEKAQRKRPYKKRTPRGKDLFEELSEEEEEEEDSFKDSGTDKNDTNWQPPYNQKEFLMTGGERIKSSRRVVLTQEQKEQVDMSTEDCSQEIYHATPLYPKLAPLPSVLIPVINNIPPDIASQHMKTPTITVMNSVDPSQNVNVVSEPSSMVNNQILPDVVTVPVVSPTSQPRPLYVFQNTNVPQIQSQSSPSQISLLPQMNNTASTNIVQQLNNSNAVSNSLLPFNNHPITTDTIGSPASISALQNIPMNTDNGDQYVLVTVVPEGGEETVIHIYKVPGTPNPTQPMIVENT